MNCKKARELILSDYTDGECGAKAAHEVRKHLEGCENCRALEKAVKTSVIYLGAAEKAEPPAFLWEKIKSNILNEKMRVPERFFIRLLKPAFALPAAALALLVLVLMKNIPHDLNGKIGSYLAEQGEFMDDLGEGNGSDNANGGSAQA